QSEKGNPRKMLLFFALVCFATSSDAAVTFSSAIIYDEYDLKGVPEIRLDKCSVGGCSIYVSAPKWSVEATRNIYVYSKSAGTNVSLYNIATEVDVTTYAKTGLHLSNTDYSLMNYNKDAVGNILICVVGGETQFYGSDQLEIYDAVNINMRPSKNKKMTIIMSAAEPYNVYVQAYEGNLNAFVRATGFDNNYARMTAESSMITKRRKAFPCSNQQSRSHHQFRWPKELPNLRDYRSSEHCPTGLSRHDDFTRIRRMFV
ncbi:hypothetical protein PRIPAC_85550, partial [Pristionchus pacificus]